MKPIAATTTTSGVANFASEETRIGRPATAINAAKPTGITSAPVSRVPEAFSTSSPQPSERMPSTTGSRTQHTSRAPMRAYANRGASGSGPLGPRAAHDVCVHGQVDPLVVEADETLD